MKSIHKVKNAFVENIKQLNNDYEMKCAKSKINLLTYFENMKGSFVVLEYFA